MEILRFLEADSLDIRRSKVRALIGSHVILDCPHVSATFVGPGRLISVADAPLAKDCLVVVRLRPAADRDIAVPLSDIEQITSV